MAPVTSPPEVAVVTDAPQILDACCGGRMWWWDKAHPLAVYMDKREAPPGSHSTRPNWNCAPDIMGDFRAMPFDDDAFNLVVFDPPHVTRSDEMRAASPTGNTLICYGALHAETEQDDLCRGFAECWRVLAPGGTLVFKWAGDLKRVQPHFPATPIVGTKTLRQGSGLGTRWIIFYKPLLAVTVSSGVDFGVCPVHGRPPSGLQACDQCERSLAAECASQKAAA